MCLGLLHQKHRPFSLCGVKIHLLALSGVCDSSCGSFLSDDFWEGCGFWRRVGVVCGNCSFLLSSLSLQSVDIDDGDFPIMVIVREVSAGIDFVNDARLDMFMDVFNQDVIVIQMVSCSSD
jgi:hypothetical protein